MVIPVASEQVFIIPDLERDNKISDKEGIMTDPWHSFFSELITSLQNIFSPEGFELPSQDSPSIQLLTAAQSMANIVYNSTINFFMGNQFNTAVDGLADPMNPVTALPYVWAPFSMMQMGSGTPVATIAGLQGMLYLDTTKTAGPAILFLCTVSGGGATDSTQATWLQLV